MTELERALLHIKTRADAWAVKEVEKALSQEPCEDAVNRQAVLDEIDDTNRRGGFGGKLSYTRCRGHIEQLPPVTQKPVECDDAIPTVVKFEGTNMACMGGDEIMKEFENNTQQNNDDAIMRKDVIQTLNKMDRYTATELTLCDTDKKFPANEVFIVDDVYEQITEQLPSVTHKSGKCKECKYFEYDSVAKVDGIPLIVAHEICNKWGNGCKTSEDGYCYLFEPQESEVRNEKG